MKNKVRKKPTIDYRAPALAVCNWVANKIDASKQTREYMLLATERSPYAAWRCYTAIFNSYCPYNDT